jgi:hypothetical protein
VRAQYVVRMFDGADDEDVLAHDGNVPPGRPCRSCATRAVNASPLARRERHQARYEARRAMGTRLPVAPAVRRPEVAAAIGEVVKIPRCTRRDRSTAASTGHDPLLYLASPALSLTLVCSAVAALCGLANHQRGQGPSAPTEPKRQSRPSARATGPSAR